MKHYDRRQGVRAADKYVYINTIKRGESIKMWGLIALATSVLTMVLFALSTSEIM